MFPLLYSSLASIALVAATVNPQVPLNIISSFNTFQVRGYEACLIATGSSNGSPVQLHDCRINSKFRTWEYVTATGPGTEGAIAFSNGKCLDITDGVNQNGTKLQIWTCTAGPNQRFNITSDDKIHWSGTNKCVQIDLSNNANDGSAIEIGECVTEPGTSQDWATPDATSVTHNPNIVFDNAQVPPPSPLCVVATNNTNGSPVQIGACQPFDHPGEPFGTINWVLPSAAQTGQISSFDGTKCLDVKDGVNANGTKLQVWSCTGGPNQQFTFDPLAETLTWAGTNKCVDLTDGNTTGGNPIQIWTCTGGPNQKWLFGNY